MKQTCFSFLLCLLVMPLHSQWAPAEWPVLKHYDKDHLYNISLPVGGIGTGTVGFGGRGELRDWQIMNKPSVGYSAVTSGNDAPFFSIWVKPKGKKAVTKGLIGPIHPSEYLHGEGRPVNHHGVPRFTDAAFEAAYPFGQALLSDKDVPVKVRIKAFNPLIPGDADASGIPIAVLAYEVENTTNEPVEVSVCGSMRNFVGMDGSRFFTDWKGDYCPVGAEQNQNVYRKAKDVQGIYMYSDHVNKNDAAWGTMALTTNATQGVTYRTSSSPNDWQNALLDFWDDFSEDGELTEKERLADNNPMASLAVKKTIAPKSKSVYCFFISWNFPNRLGWVNWENPDHDKTVYGNYYSKQYADAWEVVEKTVPQLPRLEKKTLDFVNAVLGSDYPDPIKEAALFNLNVLRSQTSFRVASGHFMGWEGTFDITGSCLGSCTHVWNYEQATAFLFGDLARTMRDVEFNYALNEQGAMSFRALFPLEKAPELYPHYAADGQMGTIMKFYRDWQLSGDNEFLRTHWEQVKKALAYAWIERWDQDQDGVMEGSQHNTMDVNYFGPNPQMGLWYLGALRAGEEMATFMKDKEFAKKCRRLFDNGSKWIDENLFNGEYYEHIVADPETFEFIDIDDPNANVPDYQLARGCLVDQLVGQYMAHVCGLGYLVQPKNVETTLRSIMKYNYKEDFSSHFNNMRSYVLGDESGLLMASWPKGRLKVPFPYFAEVMTGFEYTAAVGMIYEGQQENGLKCITSIRDRFDGYKRNPFSEPECGHHYARSMTSWAGILAWSGFNYSGVDKSMKFTSHPGTYFWSNGYSWGTCEITDNSINLAVLHGSVELKTLELSGKKTIKLKDFRLNEGENKRITY